MRLPLRLAAHETYPIRFFARTATSLRFGWAYFVGLSGSASVTINDGDPPVTGLALAAPGVTAVVVRELVDGSAEVVVEAGDAGFQGEFEFALLPSPTS